MTMVTETFDDSDAALRRLEELALGTNGGFGSFVFRGHSDEKYRLASSWQRHRPVPLQRDHDDVDRMLEAYKVGLEKLGLEAFENYDRFEALEHARHHGVPTPCLDFSYSPYVALFFAFNGVRDTYTADPEYSVIYALNVSGLALTVARASADPEQAGRDFLYPGDNFFTDGFPVGVLKFMPYPGRRNRRMQRQLGCFLYDTQNYHQFEFQDLEEYLEKLKEVPTFGPDGKPYRVDQSVLVKLRISHALTSDIFPRLELMNISGGQLYGDADGVALDVRNQYNYNSRFTYLRDVHMT